MTLALAGVIITGKPAKAVGPVTISYPLPGSVIQATECQPFSLNVVATSPTSPPDCLKVLGVGGLVPAGLTVTATGISGTPQKGTATTTPITLTIGVGEFNSTCTNYSGVFSQVTFKLTVAPCALSFTSSYLPQAKEGAAYYATLGATGGRPPYTWTATGLPPGLTLSPGGVLSGTPVVGSAGNYSFAITVADTCCSTTGYQGLGTLTVAYGTYDILVSIDNGLSAGTTQVSIDNAPVSEMPGGSSQKFEGRLGTSHVVTCSSPVVNPQNADIRFAAENVSHMVSETNPSAYFTFYPEYRIALNTNPAGIVSLGESAWYAKDKTFTISAPPVVNPAGQNNTRYEFKEWLLPNGTTSGSEDLSFIVSGPGSCTAKYSTLYALTLTSKYGNETSWHEAGSDVNWSVASPKQKMSGIMGAFGGTETALNPEGTANMTGPQEIPINYESHVFLPIALMFLLAVVVLGGGGWAVYRFALKPSRAAALPPAAAARRLPEEVIEVQGVVVDDETKIVPGRASAKSLAAPPMKRLPAGRKGAQPKISGRKPPAKKTSPSSKTRQTKRKTTRRG